MSERSMIKNGYQRKADGTWYKWVIIEQAGSFLREVIVRKGHSLEIIEKPQLEDWP